MKPATTRRIQTSFEPCSHAPAMPTRIDRKMVTTASSRVRKKPLTMRARSKSS
jgi:hypothetical protein